MKKPNFALVWGGGCLLAVVFVALVWMLWAKYSFRICTYDDRGGTMGHLLNIEP